MDSSFFFTADQLNAGYGKRQVLREVSFSLRQGCITGLLGANGSGKSTLLKAICNQLPHTGECILNGQRLEDLNIRRLAGRVSYIPQRSGITLSVSVLDVVLMGFNPVLGLFRNPVQEQKKRAEEALAAAGLAGMQERDYQSLSEGEKQLCILARTMVEDTELLLLDEPDSALDFHNRYYVLMKLRRLVQEQKKTALVCLHDPGLALDICDQLLLLKEGRCISSLRPDQDAPQVMEEKLKQIYGPLSLIRCHDGQGQSRLILLSDLSAF